jgi:hypothetical protein
VIIIKRKFWFLIIHSLNSLQSLNPISQSNKVFYQTGVESLVQLIKPITKACASVKDDVFKHKQWRVSDIFTSSRREWLQLVDRKDESDLSMKTFLIWLKMMFPCLKEAQLMREPLHMKIQRRKTGKPYSWYINVLMSISLRI